MRTIQAYRFALDLTPGQERAVNAHVGVGHGRRRGGKPLAARQWALAGCRS
ncbi:hypothetical protein ABZV78_30975 [Micromonospora sp. NPDC004540]|uniref:hypothetical protein n=1 Tax=Micromonospora sp. NPDC004540 TaxID=3154457 RepID=UPI0033A4B641